MAFSEKSTINTKLNGHEVQPNIKKKKICNVVGFFLWLSNMSTLKEIEAEGKKTALGQGKAPSLGSLSQTATSSNNSRVVQKMVCIPSNY